MIEEIMTLANQMAARYMLQKNRNLALVSARLPPTESEITQLQEILKEKGIFFVCN